MFFLYKKGAVYMGNRKYYSYLMFLFLFLFVSSAAGCAYLNPFSDSVSEYDLDGKHDLNLTVMPGDVLAFEMRNPGSGGIVLTGLLLIPSW